MDRAPRKQQRQHLLPSPKVDRRRYEQPPPVDANGIVVGQWSTGLCGCWVDCVPNCLMSTFLPFIALAQIAARIGVARYGEALLFFFSLWLIVSACGSAAELLAAYEIDAMGGQPATATTGYAVPVNESAGAAVTVYVLQLLQSVASVVLFLSTWQLRIKVRERFYIPGSCLEDCCSVCWLSCCTIAQMAAHVHSYHPGHCDFGPVDTLPAFNASDGPTGGKGSASSSDDGSGGYQEEEKGTVDRAAGDRDPRLVRYQ